MMRSQGSVSLRLLQNTDANTMALMANNIKIWNNVRNYFPHPYLEADANKFITFCHQQNPPLNFAITHDGNFCGVIGLVPLLDVYAQAAEMGYWIGEPFWGKGIVVKSIQLMVQYAFQQLHIIRLQSAVFEYNTASMRVLEKCGFTKEGIAKNAVLKNGKVYDEHRYALLKAI